MKTMFKNGLIVNGKNEPAFIGNVIIEDEKIIKITKDPVNDFQGTMT